MRLAPELHYLAAGYEQRIPPAYFSDDVDDGIIWQPDVYPETLALAHRHGRRVIIDLGCGHAEKLVGLQSAAPEIEIVGADHGPNIDWCSDNHESGIWIDVDLETVEDLPLTDDTIANSVIVCSDVLEHLVDPRPTMRLIVDLLQRGAACAVLSTPARDLRVGADYIGMPRNLAHVREWTQEEFQAFVRSFQVRIERTELTRSDDSGGGLTTQLLVVTAGGDRTSPTSAEHAPREGAMAAAERLARRRGLRLVEQVQAGASGSLVLKAQRADDTTVAIKFDHAATLRFAEWAALAAVHICPPLIHEDVSAGAVIIPWVEGIRHERGVPLTSTEQVGQLLGRLRLAVPPQDVIEFGDVVWGLLLATADGHRRLGAASPIDIEAMRVDSERLLLSPHRPTLLHGDLTTGNLIFTNSRAWAIDPRPHLGPVEWDAATWLLWTGQVETFEQHVDMLLRTVPGLDRILLTSALRFQADAFLAYRVEAGLELPADVLAMSCFDLPNGRGGEGR